MSSFCSYFNRLECRSCSWIKLAYSDQLKRKEQRVFEILKFFPAFLLEKTVESQQIGFRNRAKMVVSGTLENPIIGLIDQELLTCPIHHSRLNDLMGAMPDFIRRANLTPYQISERRGELKGLIAYYSPLSRQMYLRFILRSQDGVARIRKHLAALQGEFSDLFCITANIQPIPHAILEGPDEIILTPEHAIDHLMGELSLKLAPQAFVQTNFEVASALYQTAAKWICEAGTEKFLELYCGQGAFSFMTASSVKHLLGIDINKEAVKTAQNTAQTLGFAHLQFKQMDAAQIGDEIESFKPDLVLVNPPRRGLGESATFIVKYLPRNFVYSSCSIETLAEDLKKMAQTYHLKRAQIFDMFPHTEHFEILVWLERKEKCGV